MKTKLLLAAAFMTVLFAGCKKDNIKPIVQPTLYNVEYRVELEKENQYAQGPYGEADMTGQDGIETRALEGETNVYTFLGVPGDQTVQLTVRTLVPGNTVKYCSIGICQGESLDFETVATSMNGEVHYHLD